MGSWLIFLRTPYIKIQGGGGAHHPTTTATAFVARLAFMQESKRGCRYEPRQQFKPLAKAPCALTREFCELPWREQPTAIHKPTDVFISTKHEEFYIARGAIKECTGQMVQTFSSLGWTEDQAVAFTVRILSKPQVQHLIGKFPSLGQNLWVAAMGNRSVEEVTNRNLSPNRAAADAFLDPDIDLQFGTWFQMKSELAFP